MVKICPRCGISSDKRRFAGSFCSVCAPIKLTVPEKIEFMRCPRCERIRIEKEWKEEGKVDFAGIVLKQCRGDIRSSEFDPSTGELSLIVEQSGAFVEIKKKVEIAYEKNLCIDCSRTASGYFEAIIQLRGDEARVMKRAEEVTKLVSKKNFIAKRAELKEGIDLYVGDRNTAISTLNSLKLGYFRTETLAGERDGKRLYRTTLAVRV